MNGFDVETQLQVVGGVLFLSARAVLVGERREELALEDIEVVAADGPQALDELAPEFQWMARRALLAVAWERAAAHHGA